MPVEDAAPSFGSFDLQAAAFCLLSKSPDSGHWYFSIPHPCTPVFSAVELSENGFDSAASTPLDSGEFTLCAQRGPDGVFTVQWTEADEKTTRWAMGQGTPEEGKSRWRAPTADE